VNPALAALAVVTVAGAVIAVSAREPRSAILGLVVSGVAAPFVEAPLPGVAAAARPVAILLAGFLLWVAVRDRPSTRGSLLGARVEGVAAAAGGVVGAAAAGVAGTTAFGAGFALVVLAVGAIVVGRDALRLALGLLVAVLAAGLVRAALGGPPTAAEQLVVAALTVAVAAVGALVAARTIRSRGDLALDEGRLPAARQLPALAMTPSASGRDSVVSLGSDPAELEAEAEPEAEAESPHPSGPIRPHGFGRRSLPPR